MATLELDQIKAADVEIISKFVKLRTAPQGAHVGLCPFHQEKTPSFHVYGSGKGWFCFGCGAGGDVVNFIQRRESLDFKGAAERAAQILGGSYLPPEGRGRATPHQNARNGHSKNGAATKNGSVDTEAGPEEAPLPPDPFEDAPRSKEPDRLEFIESYPYVDETGALVYEVHRFWNHTQGKKTFKQRRPDGNGGWIWGLDKDARRPLYRLPEVLEAPAVYFVEGEKDVHTLEKLGRVATTNSGGSKQEWRAEWTEALRGKTVVIIPDQDEPGRQHGAKAMAALAGGGGDVAILTLPGGQKDITDWVAAGGTVDALSQLTREAVDAARRERMWWLRIASVADLNPEPVDWLIQSIVPANTFVLLAGRPGAFKSYVMLDMARAIAMGESFAGFPPCRPREVMYIDLENPRNMVAMRRAGLGIRNAPTLRYWGRWSTEPWCGIASPMLIEYAKAAAPVLFFDSLIRCHSADENSNTEMAAIMGQFRELVVAGATVVLLHHAGKDDARNSRGAIDIEGAPDVCFNLRRMSKKTVRLKGFKSRFGAEPTIELEIARGGFRRVSAEDIESDDPQDADNPFWFDR